MAAAAWTFGPPTSVAVLGQTLDLRIPLVADAGEAVVPECLSVEVLHGESRLDRQVVRYGVEPSPSGGRQLRVRTLVPLEEPVVQVSVGAGCPPTFFRRYTAFPDPPGIRMAGSGDSVVAIAPESAAAAAVPLSPAPAAQPSSPAGRAPARAAASAPSPAPRSVVRVPRPAQAPSVAPRAPYRRPATTDVARLRLDPISPRLKLDIDEPIMMGAAAVAAASGESVAPGAAGSAASTAADVELARLQTLERTLAQLKGETQKQRDDAARLKAELESARGEGRWLPWLLGLLGLLLVLIAWLAWRLKQSARPQQWWEDDAEEPSRSTVVVAPHADGEHEPPAPDSARGGLEDELDDDDGREYHVHATLPPEEAEWPPVKSPAPAPIAAAPLDWASAPVALASSGAPRAETAEELLDLEQQADFFVALGQDEAAVELLMDHLRSTDGQSPMPYLQLMEIHRRSDDRPAYERIRNNFHQRFNAEVPAWEDRADRGLSLEDYPEVVDRVQSLWSTPSHAMAFLESMMFRRDDDSVPFELPAYREVLLLYAIARDRLQHGDDAEAIDLLLPFEELEAAPEFTSSGATPFEFVLPESEADDGKPRPKGPPMTGFGSF